LPTFFLENGQYGYTKGQGANPKKQGGQKVHGFPIMFFMHPKKPIIHLVGEVAVTDPIDQRNNGNDNPEKQLFEGETSVQYQDHRYGNEKTNVLRK
jgi:hypothetical protein